MQLTKRLGFGFGYGVLFFHSLAAFVVAQSVPTLSGGCYLTSTVIYGNATSDGGSTSSPGALVTTTKEPSAASMSSQASVSDSGNNETPPSSASISPDLTSTTSFSSAPTSTLPPPTSSPFVVQVSGFGSKLRTRAVKYITFNDSFAYLDPSPANAAIFVLTSDDQLLTGSTYVGTSSTVGSLPLKQFSEPQSNGYKWFFNGTILEFGDASFSAFLDGRLIVVFPGGLPPDGAAEVAMAPEFVETTSVSSVPTSASTTTVMSPVESLSTGEPIPTTTIEEPATTNALPTGVSDTTEITSTTKAPSTSTGQVSSPSSAPVLASTSPSSASTPSPASSTSPRSSLMPTTTVQGTKAPPTQVSTPRSSTLSTPTSMSTTSPAPRSATLVSSSTLPSSVTSTRSVTLTNPLSATSAQVNPTTTMAVSSTTTTATLSQIPSTPMTSYTSSATSSLSSASWGASSVSPSPSLSSTSAASSSTTSSTGILLSSSSTLPATTSSPTFVTSSQMTITAAPSLVSSLASTTSISLSSNSTRSSRSFTRSSTSSTSSSSSSAISSPTAYPAKRGLAYTNVTTLGYYPPPSPYISWTYNYFSLPNASDNVGAYPSQQYRFIPLLYNDASSLTSIWAANVNYSIANYGADAIFGFNEPDACFSGKSACMNLSRTLAGYQKFMQPLANMTLPNTSSIYGPSLFFSSAVNGSSSQRLRIGAPAVTNNGNTGLDYLSQFLSNATTLNITIDFLNIHWYASPYNIDYFTQYLTQAYTVTGSSRYPLWITEFGMDQYNYPQDVVREFLKNATRWMDSQPWIERYAWFGNFANGVGGTEFLLNVDGSARGVLGDVYYTYNGTG